MPVNTRIEHEEWTIVGDGVDGGIQIYFDGLDTDEETGEPVELERVTLQLSDPELDSLAQVIKAWRALRDAP